MDKEYAQKQYRTVALTVFIIAILSLVLRIVSYYVNLATLDWDMDEAWYSILLEMIFTVPMQIGVLLVLPFLMYKLRLKKSFCDVMQFSGVRKSNLIICLLMIPLAVCCYFVSMYINTIWQIVLMVLGYTPPGGEAAMPEVFNAGHFLLMIFLTAILPGVCEEFANRGGFLTVLRSSHSKGYTIILVGIAFGLFHQNIVQLIYTAVIGALMAYLTLTTGSVLPAVTLHFCNNFIAVILQNATAYGWAIGKVYVNFIDSMLIFSFSSYATLAMLIAFSLVLLVRYISAKSKKRDVYLELNQATVASGFKPMLRDKIFFIGALVVTVASNVLTFIYGL